MREHPGARPTVTKGVPVDRMSVAYQAHPEPDEGALERRRDAKRMVKLLVGGCAACSASGLEHELYPVPEDHLTFFGGDELCGECAQHHGLS